MKENQTEVFGAVRDSYDPDGDTLTYSIDSTFGDGWLFDINSTTGELTWKMLQTLKVLNHTSFRIDDFLAMTLI